ncbi:MAG: hypothetical protein HY979_01690 [Candidatus Magasanikbacteria bacterium]|nr:hypothetical protein [Candidatus Magasanikbacteria bacterium]
MNLFYSSPGDDSDEDKNEEKDSFEELQEDEFEENLDDDEYGDGETDNSWPAGGKSDEDEE